MGRGVLRPETVAAMRAVEARRFGLPIWGLGTMLYAPDGQGSFVERDHTMAHGFAAAAADAGTERVVYLSGLHPSGELSEHLASRVEVGEIFLAGAKAIQAARAVGSFSRDLVMRYFADA